MATEVFSTEDITLLDGTEVELRPIPIAKQRKFTRLWQDHMRRVQKAISDAENPEDFNEEEITDDQYTTFIKMCFLCLDAPLKGEKTDKQFTDYLENTLDEQTIHRIIKVCGGLELGNQMTAPERAAGAGTN